MILHDSGCGRAAARAGGRAGGVLKNRASPQLKFLESYHEHFVIRKGFVNSRVVGVALEVGESKRKKEGIRSGREAPE